MTNKEISEFCSRYSITDFSIDHQIGTLENSYGPSYKYSTGETLITLKFLNRQLEALMSDAQIGAEELERARVRVDHPNVQAAYDAYITLLALTKQYDQ